MDVIPNKSFCQCGYSRSPQYVHTAKNGKEAQFRYLCRWQTNSRTPEYRVTNRLPMLDTYVDFTGRKVSNELLDMFVERIIYRSDDEFLWEMNLSGVRSDARKYRINGYSEDYSKRLQLDDKFNIIHSFLIPVEECEKYVTEMVGVGLFLSFGGR